MGNKAKMGKMGWFCPRGGQEARAHGGRGEYGEAEGIAPSKKGAPEGEARCYKRWYCGSKNNVNQKKDWGGVEQNDARGTKSRQEVVIAVSTA